MIDEAVEDMDRETTELLIGGIEEGAAQIEEFHELLSQLRGDRVPDHITCTPRALQVVMRVGEPITVNQPVDSFWYLHAARYNGRVYQAYTGGEVPQFESFRPGP